MKKFPEPSISDSYEGCNISGIVLLKGLTSTKVVFWVGTCEIVPQRLWSIIEPLLFLVGDPNKFMT